MTPGETKDLPNTSQYKGRRKPKSKIAIAQHYHRDMGLPTLRTFRL